MAFIRPEDQLKQLLIFHPKKVGKSGGVPPTPSYSVSIAPTSVEEFSNVILSASTNLTSPTFVWTLTDFKDTNGDYVSSYTGQVLTEGYFVSTGSSNVSVVATGDEGSVTGSTFSVTAIEYILDTFTGATFAYEGRKLSSSSTSAYRVRRSSDNTEQDIGFVGDELDTASLLSFVGTSGTDNGYVVTFYDQSGNGKHLSNTTASQQPKIVDAGQLVGDNGITGVYYDGVDDYIYNSSMTYTGKDFDIFSIGRREPARTGGGGALFGSNQYRLDMRDRASAQFETGLPNVVGFDDNELYKSGITTNYYRREELNMGWYNNTLLSKNQSTAWSSATVSDLSSLTWAIIGRRQDGGTKLWGWSYGAVGYNQRSPQNLIDAWQINQTNYYIRPSISGKTSAVQYETLTYTALNTMYYEDVTHTWTLPSDWVGSTTGITITGYFTGTTGGNITYTTTSGDITKTDSISVSVSSFSPDDISGLIYWIDPSDETSVSTRTSGSDVFVESINNLASTSSTYSGVSNSVAVEQPYYVTSTGMTNGLKTIMNTGFRSTYTTSLKDLGNVVTGDTFTFLRVGYHGVSNYYYAFQKIGITSTSNRIYLEETGPTSPTNDDLRIRYRESGTFRTTWKTNFWNGLYSNSGLTYGFVWENNGIDPWQFEAYIDGTQFTGWTSENTVAPTANFPIGYNANFMDHVLNASAGGQTWDGYEELGEWVCYDRVLSQSEIEQINQYLKTKWGV